MLDENSIDEITYKRWTHTDRSNLEVIVKSSEDFVESLIQMLQKYMKHNFITKMQSSAYKMTKEDLKEGQMIVFCDFAENYSFVVQDEIQSFHWNNSMVTLHPFVGYYKDEDILKHVNFVSISECNIHDSVSVHLFITQFLSHIKEKLPMINKIIYYSDGCAAQYKNCKNFLNLCHHNEDFGMDAEWNFFATSHGKGPCDGLGGTVKRLAAKASLQRCAEGRNTEQILTAEAFFKFCKDNIKNIEFKYSTSVEYEKTSLKLKDRLEMASTIAGTQKLHCFRPVDKETVIVKEFTSSNEEYVKKVSSRCAESPVSDEDIHGHVLVA